MAHEDGDEITTSRFAVVGKRRFEQARGKIDPAKVVVVLRQVLTDGTFGDAQTYTSARRGKDAAMAGWGCGRVYRIRHRGTSIMPATAEWDGQVDSATAAEWKALERAEVAAIELARAAVKADAAAEWEAQLEPVRKAYRSAVGLQRDLILAQAVAYITSKR